MLKVKIIMLKKYKCMYVKNRIECTFNIILSYESNIFFTMNVHNLQVHVYKK